MLSGSLSHFILHAPTRNFDVDVDVDGACIAVGDHNFFSIWPQSRCRWLVVCWVDGRSIDGGRRKT